MDLVLDMLAGRFTADNLACLRRGGRLAVIGVMDGPKSTVPMHRVLTQQLTIAGSTLRTQPADVKAKLAREIEGRLWARVLDGSIRPAVAACMSLERVDEAQALLDARSVVGKVILEVGGEEGGAGVAGAGGMAGGS